MAASGLARSQLSLVPPCGAAIAIADCPRTHHDGAAAGAINSPSRPHCQPTSRRDAAATYATATLCYCRLPCPSSHGDCPTPSSRLNGVAAAHAASPPAPTRAHGLAAVSCSGCADAALSLIGRVPPKRGRAEPTAARRLSLPLLSAIVVSCRGEVREWPSSTVLLRPVAARVVASLHFTPC